MPTPPSIVELRSLTGLRWLAALLVFAYHVHVIRYFRDGAAGTAVDWLFGAGVTGVSFFFVLSGFVLAWSARDGDRPQRFWLRRIARIYPVHVVCALAALLLLWVQSPQLLPKADALLANLFLVHAWILDSRFDQSLDPVSWSLACEAFFYALFPLIFALLRRAGDRTMWTVAAGSTAVVFIVPFFLSGHAMHVSRWPGSASSSSAWRWPAWSAPGGCAARVSALRWRSPSSGTGWRRRSTPRTGTRPARCPASRC